MLQKGWQQSRLQSDWKNNFRRLLLSKHLSGTPNYCSKHSRKCPSVLKNSIRAWALCRNLDKVTEHPLVPVWVGVQSLLLVRIQNFVQHTRSFTAIICSYPLQCLSFSQTYKMLPSSHFQKTFKVASQLVSGTEKCNPWTFMWINLNVLIRIQICMCLHAYKAGIIKKK